MYVIEGKLHCEEVSKIESTKSNILEFKMDYDSAEILDFEISDNVVELGIEWTDYPPKERRQDYTYTKIRAKKSGGRT